jgi:hypothetical protein
MLAIYSLPLGLLAAGVLIGWIGFRATASLYAVVGLRLHDLIAVKWRARCGSPHRRRENWDDDGDRHGA